MQWTDLLKTPPMQSPVWGAISQDVGLEPMPKVGSGCSRSPLPTGPHQTSCLTEFGILKGSKKWEEVLDTSTGKCFVSPRESFDCGESNPFFVRPSMLNPQEVQLQKSMFGKKILELKGK